MRLTTADVWAPEPGRMLIWQVKADGPGVVAALSLNQRNHLGAAAAGEPSVWLAAAFDVEGPIDEHALDLALRDLVARHSSFQLEAVLGEGRGDSGTSAVTARRHHPATLRWSTMSGPETTTAAETRAVLRALFAEGCHPFSFPAYVPVAISRPERSTIVLGMDHVHCDAHSVAIVVNDLAALYDGHRLGIPAALEDPSCFLMSVEREVESPVRVWPDDERLREWHDFLRERDFALPTFPLPLGVPAGERVAQATLVQDFVDAETMAQVSARAREAGSTTYAVVLAALAAAIRDLGGPERLDTLAPVSTRTDEGSRHAVGWYTTTVPVSIGADLTQDGLAAAGRAVRGAVALAEIPLSEVLASLPAPLVRTRGDVFMVSWLDYRRLPGAALSRARRPHHVSAPTRADDVQLWLARTDDGLQLRVRMPETDTAREVMDAVVTAWALRIRELAEAPAPAARP